jgi:RNA polymerase sigma-70 factor (ECF subfamily)
MSKDRVDSNPLNDAAAPDESGGAGAGATDELSRAVRERLRERDPDALAQFYEAYFDRLYGYVRRLLGEEHLAEDVTQDIFMHIYKSLNGYDPSRDLRPWVFTIATNKVRDFWRSRRFRDTRRETQIDEEESGSYGVSAERGPVEQLEGEELSQTVARAVEALPEGMRTTLTLRYFEGLSFEAIGEIIGRNEAAVRKRYSRAMDELRQSLERVLDLPAGGPS